jgi:hypothetical protein
LLVSNSLSLSELPDEIESVLNDCAHSYSKKILLAEIDGCMWGFVSSFYSSSSLMGVIKFNIEPSIVLSLIKTCKAGEIFEFSEKIKSHPSRQKDRVREYRKSFLEFCNLASSIFVHHDNQKAYFESYDFERELTQMFLNISSFVGCPIEIGVANRTSESDSYMNTDIQLLIAFLCSVLCYARVNDKMREAKVELRLGYWSPGVMVQIFHETPVDIHELLEEGIFADWERIVFDKQMPFGVFAADGGIKIGFQPHRAELSLVDIKTLWDDQ